MILTTTISGTGPDLILIHGLFGAAKNLGVIARALAPHFRVTALDVRNHGASNHARDMRYATLAADVAETMDSLDIPTAIAIGHSMGGKIAMTLALHQPDRVAALAVLDIAPIDYGDPYLDNINAMRALRLTPNLTRSEADRALAADLPDPALRGFLLNNLILGDAPHWRIALDEIAAALPDLVSWQDPSPFTPYEKPTLFLRGETSDYVPAIAQSAIMARFPKALIETIANAGHWLHAERPAKVVAALLSFLDTELP